MFESVQRDRKNQTKGNETSDEFFVQKRSENVAPEQTSAKISLQRQYDAAQLLKPMSERIARKSVFPLQTKLTIGAVNSPYEQEADRVANEVVRQIHTNQKIESSKDVSEEPSVQRSPDRLQRPTSIRPLVQRQELLEEGAGSQELESGINRARGGGHSLDAKLQKSMGQAMGMDFSGVRVHTDSHADTLNRSIQAKAFTTGQDVFFRRGAYQTGSQEGEKLIAHELTHVVQQGGSPSSNYIHRMPANANEKTSNGNYSIKKSDRDWLYGKLDATVPKPTKLYETKKFEGENDEDDYMGWRANVAFIDEMKRARKELESYTMSDDEVLDDEDEIKIQQNQERFKSASIVLSEVVQQISEDENRIGLIADNDCAGFAFALRNLIYQELFTENPTLIDTTTQQQTWFGQKDDSVSASDMEMGVGDTMTHLFDPKTKLETVRCGGHHSTVVAKDGSEIISLEAHAGKKDLNRPSFHIRGGVDDFVQESQINSKGLKTNVGTQGYVTKGVDPQDEKRRIDDMYKDNREKFLRFLEENQKDVAVRTKVIGLDKESLGDLVPTPEDSETDLEIDTEKI